MSQHNFVDIAESCGVAVKPVEITVEQAHRRLLCSAQPVDGRECVPVTV